MAAAASAPCAIAQAVEVCTLPIGADFDVNLCVEAMLAYSAATPICGPAASQPPAPPDKVDLRGTITP